MTALLAVALWTAAGRAEEDIDCEPEGSSEGKQCQGIHCGRHEHMDECDPQCMPECVVPEGEKPCRGILCNRGCQKQADRCDRQCESEADCLPPESDRACRGITCNRKSHKQTDPCDLQCKPDTECLPRQSDQACRGILCNRGRQKHSDRGALQCKPEADCQPRESDQACRGILCDQGHGRKDDGRCHFLQWLTYRSSAHGGCGYRCAPCCTPPLYTFFPCNGFGVCGPEGCTSCGTCQDAWKDSDAKKKRQHRFSRPKPCQENCDESSQCLPEEGPDTSPKQCVPDACKESCPKKRQGFTTGCCDPFPEP